MYEEIDFTRIIAVSNRHVSRLPYLEQVERILSFHPKAFLLREKDLEESQYLALAEKVHRLCKKYRVELIAHYYPEAAERLGVDALHLPLWKLEDLAGDGDRSVADRKIGVSVHSLEEASKAVGLGASYLTAGHVFATDCKKGLAPRGLPFLKEICDSVEVPVYGIGGIRLEPPGIAGVMEQGAAGVCIMSQMMRM